MQPLFLAVVFTLIIGMLALKRPLYQAIFSGLVAMVLLFHIAPVDVAQQTLAVFTNWGSLTVLLSMYLITYLQRMLEARQQIKLAQQDLDGIFHNRRVNATLAPVFIGLLPAAAAVVLCGDIVKDATDGYLEPKEQAFITSWFRHIPEIGLPTYGSVILMLSLSGVPLPTFMTGMLLPACMLAVFPYFGYLRRLPKDPGTPRSENRGRDAIHLFQHLWTLIVTLILLLVFQLDLVLSVTLVIAAAALVYRFSLTELRKMVVTAFDTKLLVNTFLVLVLKNFIAMTGVLAEVAELLSALPIPTYLVFCLIFLLGGIISGASGIIALGTPLAFAAIPHGGMPLMVLLMGMTHIASQLSPTHVCLMVASDYYHITIGELIRKTVPTAMLFVLFMIGYYHLLLLVC